MSPLSNAMASCSSLTKLHVEIAGYNFSKDFFKALLPKQMRYLEFLRFSDRRDNNLASFEYIAGVTSKLKTFICEILGPISPNSIFDIWQANPNLSHVKLSCIYKGTEEEETSAEYLKIYFRAFKSCKGIRTLKLDFGHKC